MKATINQKEIKASQFNVGDLVQYIGKDDPNLNRIVLVTSFGPKDTNFSGVLLYKDGQKDDLGSYFQYFIRDFYKLYTGSITLEN